MPRIAWIEVEDATGELAEIYAQTQEIYQGRVPEIVRTMSLRPDFMRSFLDMGKLHFSEGALTYAQHELIASYVAALDKCHF